MADENKNNLLPRPENDRIEVEQVWQRLKQAAADLGFGKMSVDLYVHNHEIQHGYIMRIEKRI